MSKKRFTDGLDELLNDAAAEQEFAGDAVDQSAAPARRASGGKTFTTDLNALLEEALEESLEKYESGKPMQHKIHRNEGLSPLPPRFSGIDALIRQTISIEELTGDEQSGKKRLTVAVDKPKLEKLKVIARLENAYLKDLMVGLIDEYIQAYARNKGIEL
ncbi:MAG: hypothetical protein ACOYNO_05310 [Saprospiraceae bacterium]